ncbi:MAG: hypothetical protein NVSMB45_16370 [Ginsengibacter sp.]
MKEGFENKKHYSFPVKTFTATVFILALVAIISSGYKNKIELTSNGITAHSFLNNDSSTSAKAFLEVYKVLMSPRCMNCHPAGDKPLQGDDSHIHNMNVQRGKDGKGLYAMKCANCHQPSNIPGLHMPPGNPKWHLPPADMKMVFQGRTPHQLALQIMNFNQNGHKNKQQLLDHAKDTLVKQGWHPGEGRSAPPLSYKDFVSAWNTWINKGGFAPHS